MQLAFNLIWKLFYGFSRRCGWVGKGKDARSTDGTRSHSLSLLLTALFTLIHVQNKNQLTWKHMCNKSVDIHFYLLEFKKIEQHNFWLISQSTHKLTKAISKNLTTVSGFVVLGLVHVYCCNNCKYIYIYIYMSVYMCMCVCCMCICIVYICVLWLPKSCSSSQLFNRRPDTCIRLEARATTHSCALRTQNKWEWPAQGCHSAKSTIQ